MRRRSFLELLALGVSLLIARPARLLRGPGRAGSCRFYVAGVRFHPAAGRVQEGEPVEVRVERFREEICCALYSVRGERIGYIPKERLREVAGRNVLEATLSEVRPDAIPWKRLQVTLELA
jgi:hypothetical protein